MNSLPKDSNQKNFLKAAFLDRDGVINMDYGYVYLKKDFHLVRGVFDALRYLINLNYKIIIITNQSGIARGYYKERDFKKLSHYMNSLFKEAGINIQDIFYCPHHPNGKVIKYRKICHCRKPNNGMIEEAISKYKIDREKSILIGNSFLDIKAGEKSNIESFLFQSNNLCKFVVENIKS